MKRRSCAEPFDRLRAALVVYVPAAGRSATVGLKLSRHEAEDGDRSERIAVHRSGLHRAYDCLGDFRSELSRFDGVLSHPPQHLGAQQRL